MYEGWSYWRCPDCKNLWSKKFRNEPPMNFGCPDCHGPQEGVRHEAERQGLIEHVETFLDGMTREEAVQLFQSFVDEKDAHLAFAQRVFERAAIEPNERWAAKYVRFTRGFISLQPET